jgi:hypothetical protein
MLSPLTGNLGPLGASRLAVIKHFLRDYFHNGPVTSPRACEDLGYLHFIDPSSYTISGDALNFPSSASIGGSGGWEATAGNTQISRTRTAGLAILGSFALASIVGGQSVPAIWKKTAGSTNATAGDGGRWGIVEQSGAFLKPLNNTDAAGFNLWPFSLSTTYQLAIVLRTTGYWLLIKGGIFADWSLAWVGSTGNDTPVYAAFTPSLGDPIALYDWHIVQLTSPLNSDYGIAAQRFTGAVEWGQSFVHEADSVLEMTITTLPSAGVIEVDFREENDSNKMSVEIGSGGAVNIYETVAGVKSSTLGSGTIAAGQRLCVHMLGARLRISTNESSGVSTDAATNLTTMTAGVLQSLGTGGVVSNLNVWPIAMSAAAKSVLNRARL